MPNRRIDFIFVTKGIAVQEHRIITEQRKDRFPSDHLPVMAKVQLLKEEKK